MAVSGATTLGATSVVAGLSVANGGTCDTLTVTGRTNTVDIYASGNLALTGQAAVQSILFPDATVQTTAYTGGGGGGGGGTGNFTDLLVSGNMKVGGDATFGSTTSTYIPQLGFDGTPLYNNSNQLTSKGYVDNSLTKVSFTYGACPQYSSDANWAFTLLGQPCTIGRNNAYFNYFVNMSTPKNIIYTPMYVNGYIPQGLCVAPDQALQFFGKTGVQVIAYMENYFYFSSVFTSLPIGGQTIYMYIPLGIAPLLNSTGQSLTTGTNPTTTLVVDSSGNVSIDFIDVAAVKNMTLIVDKNIRYFTLLNAVNSGVYPFSLSLVGDGPYTLAKSNGHRNTLFGDTLLTPNFSYLIVVRFNNGTYTIDLTTFS